jgi:LacI family transcriptional regulator
MALREHPSIPAATRERIRAAATQLGYEPNPVFAALTRFHIDGRVRAAPPRLGYIVNRSLEKGAVFHDHHHALLEGARQQARTLGYELERLYVGEDHHDSRSVEKHLRSKKISGVIVADFEPGFASLSLNWDEYAIVKINSMHLAPDAALISNDHLRDVRLAFKHLTALGYRRIGLATGRADEERTNHRQTAGYFVEQAAIPPEQRIPPLLFPLNSSADAVTKVLRHWVRQHKIDAVLCSWPNIDELLAAARLRVPHNVACASLAVVDPESRLTGIRPNLAMVGIKAVSLLVTQVKSGERGVPEFASTTYVQSFWQDGPSAPPKI